MSSAVGAAWLRCVPCPWWQLPGLVWLKSLIFFLLVSNAWEQAVLSAVSVQPRGTGAVCVGSLQPWIQSPAALAVTDKPTLKP